MAEAESDTDAARCRALTASGSRCSRSAGDDGFCHQHDESDPTVDEEDVDREGAAAGDQNEGEETMSTETKEAEAEEQDESAAENEQAESGVDTAEKPVADVDESTDDAGGGEDAPSGEADLWDARETAERVANELIDDPFDGIIEISRADEGGGWKGVVEVIERRAIPDTQDILGRYEVSIGEDGDLEGYRLTGRYRRGDVHDEQAPAQ